MLVLGGESEVREGGRGVDGFYILAFFVEDLLPFFDKRASGGVLWEKSDFVLDAASASVGTKFKQVTHSLLLDLVCDLDEELLVFLGVLASDKYLNREAAAFDLLQVLS